jgi:hypothetical protein
LTKLETAPDRTVDLSLVPLTRACSAKESTHRIIFRREYARYILPTDARARATAIAFFSADARTRLGLCVFSSLAGKSGAVPCCAAPLLEEVLASIHATGAHWAISNSMPGPWSKGTVLVMDPRRRPRAVVKVGNAEIAAALIENESGWLRTLARRSVLARAVPRLLDFRSRGSATWLAQEPLAGSPAGPALKPPHLRFLGLLQQELPIARGFPGSAMETEMQTQLREIGPRIGAEWRERVERGLEQMRTLLPADLLMTAAHRDFAPFNLRVSHGELRVFDWEHARLGYIPLYDVFHFLLAPLAVRAPLAPARIRAAIRKAARGATALQQPASAPAQCLAYLLALSLSYMHGRGGTADEPVTRHCAAAIDALARECGA